MKSSLRSVSLIGIIVLLASAFGGIMPAKADTIVFINEVDADQVSTDSAEFVELYDGGSGNTDLTDLVLVLFNGSDDASYQSFDLDGWSTDADGYFVLCGDAANVANCDLDVSPDTNLIQNGADAVALIVGDAADFPNDTPVTTDNLVDAIVYDTSDSDDAGLLVLLNAGQPQVNERGEGDGTGHSNQRCPNGSGGARNTDTYTQAVPTPGGANTCVIPMPDIVINEVDADQVSTDSAEFIELYDGGDGNTALDGLVVVLYNGSDDQSYTPAIDLDGYSTDANGYFIIGTVDGADIYVAPGTYGWLQNGADAVALHVGDAADFPNDTPVTTDNLVDAIVYDTSDSDDAGLLALLNAGQPQVNEGGSGDKDNHSNQRCPNGFGGARNTDTYAQFLPTPGSAATCEEPPPPSDCGLPYTPIYTVQGDGFASPLDGTQVDVEGIVTGDLQDGKYGFTIQDPLGDGDITTSDGIFVYTTSLDVNVGDHVRVTGYVDEYYGLTEITSVSDLEICSTGNAIAPTPISLPVLDTSDLEAYEGMLVTFPQSLYISEYYNFGRYGEIVLSTSRQFQPTATYDPGSVAAAQMLADNLLNRIKLDDGRGSENPDPALHPNGSIFDLSNLFRGGDVLNNLTGVVDYNYGEYKIQPTIGADSVSLNPRTAHPDDVGGSLKVASFNVLNYFSTIDTGAEICGPNLDLRCRGADTAEEFERQRTKIFAALAAMDADVVGLIEIENNTEAIQDLVDGLNTVVGAGTYAYVDTGYIGGDAIKVAFIYKTATVSLVGDYAVLDTSVDSRFIDTKNRPVLAQTFMDSANGGIFTAAVNHLKSKGSDCDAIGDPDLDDGAGNCNLTRTAAAEALVDWLATDPTSSGDADFLIIGDLNAYDKEDPIDAILAGGYSDLVYQYLGENAYSYVFDGQLGYLDHALANGALGSEISGVTVWHINADEASLIDYDMSYKKDAQDAIYAPDAYRSSDHDPVIIGLNLNGPPVADAGGPYTVGEGSSIALDASGSYDPDPSDTLLYEWDFDADGNYDDALGANPTFSAADEDGPATLVVGLQVTDLAGLSDMTTADIVIENISPTAEAGPDQAVNRNDVVLVEGSWTDPAGILDNDYAWTWDLDGDGVEDIWDSAQYGDAVPATTSFGVEGFYTLTFSVTDDDGGFGSDTVLIEVLNQAPVCAEAMPSVDLLWPANHKFVAVEILGVTDPEGDAFTITIDSIFQDELVDDGGDGNTWPDGQGIGTSVAQVRAERTADGNGRVYHIAFTADDGHGGTCSGEVLVGVPHDSGKKTEMPEDDGANFDSTLEPEAMIVPESTEETSDKDKKGK